MVLENYIFKNKTVEEFDSVIFISVEVKILSTDNIQIRTTDSFLSIILVAPKNSFQFFHVYL